ncbi:AIPR family protein [Neobacillus sp. PS2-9]|uniref:AIPR family protein n=1 Tax=Neobacillus sp. PS2-9 TaxID=3070676 RepID=UPI0027DEF9ED|nr:AIPR family protein [Neobacillus sp. PS2-9]WML56503.1 AIPR family protein [Neobacillus sp. PS2-9]
MLLDLHKENIIGNFVTEVVEEMNEADRTLDAAFTRISAKWLGYELEDNYFVDGSGDRGLDFWYPTDSGFDLFQVKTQENLDPNYISNTNFDKTGVMDLVRIKNYLTDKDGIPEHNERLKRFKERWTHVISSKRLAEKENNVENLPISVNLNLILIGNGLTKQANDEFEALKRSFLAPFQFDDKVKIEFRANLINVSHIIEAKWREENREWKNISGKKQNWIELRCENKQILNNSLSAVFYCPAIDLVSAYNNFGYQLFEPNVRCNIKKSKVNSAIKDSIKHRASRKEFRYLNNGVTIICNNYTSPSDNRKWFRVTEPGIVNGLQTVISITEAYNALSNDEKEDFEKNCYVLVRLLLTNAVKNVDKVVRATNTQNKMESRNLLSNNPEQILYEKLFAELGWFYERKQGAWDAFAMDSKRWSTLNNKRKSDFLINPKHLGSKARTVDNESIAQTWMAFIGFSEEAVHEKSKIFDREDWYNLIFMNRPQEHGFDYKYHLQTLSQESLNIAPTPELLLVSNIVRNFARNVTPSAKENFSAACLRNGIDPSKKSREEVIAELSKDSEYLLGLALSGMSFNFVEYFGYALFRAFGPNIYNIGQSLLKNGVMADLYLKQSYKEIKDIVDKEFFDKNDILCVLWYSFRHVINEMLSSFWAESFRSAGNRSRFITQKDTRTKIIQGLEDLHKYTIRTQYTKIWASGIETDKGLFGFIQDSLINPRQKIGVTRT